MKTDKPPVELVKHRASANRQRSRILTGDALAVLKTLADQSIQMCVTSPPYWCLRDYGVPGQLGLEPTPEEYVTRMVEVFREVRRVLKDDGTCWLNLGDSYAGGGGFSAGAPSSGKSKSGKYGSLGALKAGGIKPAGILKTKDLVGIPWRVAFALQADGWYLRSDIIWHKPNPMPESVTDRPTKAHEYLFLLSKSERYYYDADAVREPCKAASIERWKPGSTWDGERTRGYPTGAKHSMVPAQMCHPKGRNHRTVWTVCPKPFKGAHFATFPPKLIEPCILAGSRKGDTVLDPFNGAGTSGMVALEHGRRYLGIELNPAYVAMTEKRMEPLCSPACSPGTEQAA